MTPTPLHPPILTRHQSCYFIRFPWPISFNSYKRGLYTTKKGRIWRDNAVADVWRQCGGQRPDALIGRVGLWFEVCPPDDRRKRDVDNAVGKHFQDMLAKAGIMSDDSQVTEYHVWRCAKWQRGCVLLHAVEL